MAEAFSNDPLPVDHLPRLRDDDFVPVDPRYLRGWLAGIGLLALAVVVGAAILAVLVDEPTAVLIIAGITLAVLAAPTLLWVFEVRRLAYQLRAHDLSLRSGALVHKVETVPFVRVQHVSVRRGPFERALGLATLDVSSAGPDISVPGLAVDEATRIKRLVTERAGVDDDGSTPDLP